MHIAKNDIVEVIAGNDRGKRGKVLKVVPTTKRVIVEGVNFIHRHTKPRTQGDQGGIIEKEAPIDASNVMLVDPDSGKPGRVRNQRDENGRRVRTFAKSGNPVPDAR